MRVLIQRVLKASVTIDQKMHSQIGPGLLLFLGVHTQDTQKQADWLADKCVSLRLFEDKNSSFNQSVLEIQKDLLIVSQFTLYGSCHKGRRPEFTQAAKGEVARNLYNHFIEKISKHPLNIQTGVFGADMQIELVNDGPVTLLIER